MCIICHNAAISASIVLKLLTKPYRLSISCELGEHEMKPDFKMAIYSNLPKEKQQKNINYILRNFNKVKQLSHFSTVQAHLDPCSD